MALQSLGERIADLLVAEGIDKFFHCQKSLSASCIMHCMIVVSH